jgi:hypothetical protein
MMTKRLLKLLILSLVGCSTLAEARLPPIKPGVPGKKRGDIIAPMLDEQVAAWCDFNKQIIMTRTNILCVYVGGEQHMATETAAAAPVPAPTPMRAPTPLASKSLPAKKGFDLKPSPKDLTNPYEMSEYGDV